MSSDLEVGLYVFMLATFVGLEVIRRVSPLLHTPLMAFTNAISGISVVASILIAGRKSDTLLIPILGAIALGYVKIRLGEQTAIDNSLVLGALLIVVVLGIPRGVVPAVQHLWAARGRWARRRGAKDNGARRRLGVAAEERS